MAGNVGSQSTTDTDAGAFVWGRNRVADFLLAFVLIVPVPLVIAFCQRGDSGLVSAAACIAIGLVFIRAMWGDAGGQQRSPMLVGMVSATLSTLVLTVVLHSIWHAGFTARIGREQAQARVADQKQRPVAAQTTEVATNTRGHEEQRTSDTGVNERRAQTQTLNTRANSSGPVFAAALSAAGDTCRPSFMSMLKKFNSVGDAGLERRDPDLISIAGQTAGACQAAARDAAALSLPQALNLPQASEAQKSCADFYVNLAAIGSVIANVTPNDIEEASAVIPEFSRRGGRDASACQEELAVLKSE